MGGCLYFARPIFLLDFFRLMIIYAPGAGYRHFLHVMNFNFCRRILARRKNECKRLLVVLQFFFANDYWQPFPIIRVPNPVFLVF